MDHLSGADEPAKGASWLEGAALALGEDRGHADLYRKPLLSYRNITPILA
jgi:hypothetical protein